MRIVPVAVLLAFAVVVAATTRGGAREIRTVDAGRGAQAVTALEMMTTYCVPCHTDRRKSGGLSLAHFDPAAPAADLETAEKIIRKVRAGLMPPSGARRPEPATLTALAVALESTIDNHAATAAPAPALRPFQRLTRAEYAQAIRDLVGIEIDAAALLPADTISGGFDNVADVQTFSPTLVTSYLQAGRTISTRAVASNGNSRIFVCRPARAANEPACARKIVTALTSQAYRGAATDEDLRDALSFYERGRTRSDFREGIRLALQSILVSPRFLFRLEPSAGGDTPEWRAISDVALASRLSFFLWGRAPDGPLLAAAQRGLQRPGVIDAQVTRMLADPRSEALASRFARQWLRLQDLEAVSPDPALYPDFDPPLAASMLRETELFFDSIVRDDRNVLDLLTADYSFVDARLARHYGLPSVSGEGFRKVTVPETRRGLLGQGSILMATSLAGRTSPVLRGKWVLEVLLGTPPPPPPPNVPALDDSAAPVKDGVRLSTRQRMEQHRRSPQCSSCHRVIDPLGLTLENFDVTGSWRQTEDGAAIDALGELYDGTSMNGPEGLRLALLQRQEVLLRTFTENLLTYALGRRLTVSDMPLVRAIVARAAAEQYRFSSFVRGVTASAPFVMTGTAR